MRQFEENLSIFVKNKKIIEKYYFNDTLYFGISQVNISIILVLFIIYNTRYNII